MKKRIRTIIGIIVGIIIGVSTTVGAATIFNSKDITYSNSATSKTNVKDSLDELYTKAANVGKCPEDFYCYTEPLAISDNVDLGDYISMTPTSANYQFPSSFTGTGVPNVINPSELNLWRVIRKNDDGTIVVVSEYVSNESITFAGETGYRNFITGLNQIAAQYTTSKYVQSTEYMGEGSIDVNLIKSAIGTLIGENQTGAVASYWIASLYTYVSQASGRYSYGCYYVNANGVQNYDILKDSSASYSFGHAVRPILVLKANITIKSGNGKSASTAYQLN